MLMIKPLISLGMGLKRLSLQHHRNAQFRDVGIVGQNSQKGLSSNGRKFACDRDSHRLLKVSGGGPTGFTDGGFDQTAVDRKTCDLKSFSSAVGDGEVIRCGF